MISKTLLLTLVIPAIIRLLFVLSLKETDKSNIVHEPKLLYLYVPLFGCFLFSFGSFFNIKDYLKNANPNIDNLIFGIFLSILSIICLIMVIYYKSKKIIYNDNSFCYRGKTYSFDDVLSLGDNQNDNVFVLKDGKKIKFSILAVGSNELCKAYYAYKKKNGKTNNKKK